jgi:hypothetical protein
LTSLYNTTWYLGSIVAAWATFGTFNVKNEWSWRIPSALQGLPSVIQVLLIFFIPESPRWLVNKGRDEEAIRVLGKYHCGGDMQDPLIAFEYQEIKAALALEAEAKQITWISMFKSRGNLKVGLVCGDWRPKLIDSPSDSELSSPWLSSHNGQGTDWSRTTCQRFLTVLELPTHSTKP